jgi:hypothetical protein
LRGSRQLADETITLLVHQNGVFPHDAGAAVDITLIGANVDDAFVLFGSNHILTQHPHLSVCVSLPSASSTQLTNFRRSG